MADETLINQKQANRINRCENNQTCVDKEIKKVSDELIIIDVEVTEIKEGENNRKNESYQACYKERGFTYYFYCSSTTHEVNSFHVWRIHFGGGVDYMEHNQTREHYVRCLRSR